MSLKGLCYGMFLQHKDELRTAIRKCGRLAGADYGDGRSEGFAWDGLALVRRGDESFVNEPHVGDAPKKLRFGGKPRAKRSARRARKGPRGNPVASSKGVAYLNDALGTTVGVREGRGTTRKGAKRRYTAAALTAFGEPVPVAATSHNSNIRQFDHSIISSPFFTGKPQVEGLGRVFLYRNYRSDLAKWQTADPLGYPDGWNQLAYGVNSPLMGLDLFGARWDNIDFVSYYFLQDSDRPNYLDTDIMGLTDPIFLAMERAAESALDQFVKANCSNSAGGSSKVGFGFGVDCESIVYALGGGSGRLLNTLFWSWYTTYKWEGDHLYEYKYYEWSYSGAMKYSDSFRDPVDVLNLIKRPDLEVPGGRPYAYGHIWQDITFRGNGTLSRKLIE